MTVTGLDFVALQVRDLGRSARFYETKLGLLRAPSSPKAAVVFATAPIPFAVRAPLPGVDLDQAAHAPALALHSGFAATTHASCTVRSQRLERRP